MPIYEFKCRKCKTTFQDLFSSSVIDVDAVVCPKCGERQADKLLSVFASDVKSSDQETMPAAACGPHCACHPA